MRAHPMANALGATMTNYWNNNVTSDEDYYYLVANEWVVTDRLDASTGQNFTSWADFFGPSSFYDGDSFTKIVRAVPVCFLLRDVFLNGKFRRDTICRALSSILRHPEAL